MLLYISLIRSKQIVAEYSESQGDFAEICLNLYYANIYNKSSNPENQINNENNVVIIPYSKYEIYFYINTELVISVISLNESKQSINNIIEFVNSNIKIIDNLPNVANLGVEYKDILQKAFKRSNLEEHEEALSKINLVEQELERLKQEKIDFLDKTIEKDFDLESICSKSENLKNSSKEIRQKIRRKLQTIKKNTLRDNVFVILVLLIVVGVVCFKIGSYVNLNNSSNINKEFYELSMNNLNSINKNINKLKNSKMVLISSKELSTVSNENFIETEKNDENNGAKKNIENGNTNNNNNTFNKLKLRMNPNIISTPNLDSKQ